MTDSAQFRIERLDPAGHRREAFHCESVELTEFIRARARREMAARTSACFVLVPAQDQGRITGFYTLSAAAISAASLPQAFTKRLPRSPCLPVTLPGRLARDEAFRGQGIGDRLISELRSEITVFRWSFRARFIRSVAGRDGLSSDSTSRRDCSAFTRMRCRVSRVARAAFRASAKMKLPTDWPAIAAAWLMIALSSAETRVTKRSRFRGLGCSKAVGMGELCTKWHTGQSRIPRRLPALQPCVGLTGGCLA